MLFVYILGAINISYDGDFNNAPMGIRRIATNSPAHSPSSLAQYRGWLFTCNVTYTVAYRWQVYNDTQANKTWERNATYDGTWSEWRLISTDIPSFYKNYSTLKSIAEAAGACYAYSPLQSADDFNNYTNTGFVLVYSVAITAGIQNAPDNISYGFLEIKRINSDRIMQTYTKWGEKTFYACRYFENTSWGTWKYS